MKSINITRSDQFIPAGAGNTVWNWRSRSPQPVYPRWRGEHHHSLVAEIIRASLSPLARGTRTPPVRVCENLQFIPAGAGNTLHCSSSTRIVSVYPRWRGEHRFNARLRHFRYSLSPLARGTRYRCSMISVLRQFIPAGAGNTSHASDCNRCFTVYPRWRGEHAYGHAQTCHSASLSPLARGTLPGIVADDVAGQFIPAGAGNT